MDHLLSTFSDIFDELHFIETLRGDVRIVKELPRELEALPRARKHFTSWSGVSYYEELTQLWKDYQVKAFDLSQGELLNHVCLEHFQELSFSFKIFLLSEFYQILAF